MATQNPVTPMAVADNMVNNDLRKRPHLSESLIKGFLFFCGILSVFTTIAIVFILLEEAVAFFSRTQWENTNRPIAAEVLSTDQALIVSSSGGTLRVDGALLRVDATNGSQRGLARLPIEYQGERFGDARLRGISHAGQGRYLVSGDLTNTIANLGPVFLSAAVAPSDRIFADGFDRSVVLPTL